MKLWVSLPEEDGAVSDRFAARAGLRARSAALQYAARLLRLPGIEHHYADAWAEWERSGEQASWEGTAADGLP